MGIRSQGAVYMHAKTSISSLKEQFISPDDHLVNKIASWQEDCGYKRLTVSDAMKISGMKQKR